MSTSSTTTTTKANAKADEWMLETRLDEFGKEHDIHWALNGIDAAWCSYCIGAGSVRCRLSERFDSPVSSTTLTSSTSSTNTNKRKASKDEKSPSDDTPPSPRPKKQSRVSQITISIKAIRAFIMFLTEAWQNLFNQPFASYPIAQDSYDINPLKISWRDVAHADLGIEVIEADKVIRRFVCQLCRIRVIRYQMNIWIAKSHESEDLSTASIIKLKGFNKLNQKYPIELQSPSYDPAASDAESDEDVVYEQSYGYGYHRYIYICYACHTMGLSEVGKFNEQKGLPMCQPQLADHCRYILYEVDSNLPLDLLHLVADYLDYHTKTSLARLWSRSAFALTAKLRKEESMRVAELHTGLRKLMKELKDEPSAVREKVLRELKKEDDYVPLGSADD